MLLQDGQQTDAAIGEELADEPSTRRMIIEHRHAPRRGWKIFAAVVAIVGLGVVLHTGATGYATAVSTTITAAVFFAGYVVLRRRRRDEADEEGSTAKFVGEASERLVEFDAYLNRKPLKVIALFGVLYGLAFLLVRDLAASCLAYFDNWFVCGVVAALVISALLAPGLWATAKEHLQADEGQQHLV